MTNAPSEKPWVWTSLGTAAMIVLCCGVAPVAIIAGVQATRDSPPGSGKGSAVAKASHRPSPASASPAAPSASAAPSPLPSISVGTSPSLPLEAPPWQEPATEEPPAYQPPPEDPPLPPLPQPPPRYEPVPPSQEVAPQQVVPPQEVALPQVARIGDAIRSGVLEFVVREVRCGLKQVGSGSGAQQTAGQFCVVTVSVRNLSELTLSLLEDAQKAMDANGFEYATHSLATAAANGPANVGWFTGISPGAFVSGAFVFELPEGVGLARVVLAGGVTVSVD